MTYDSETYEQMAAAISFIHQHHLEQPDLEAIAAHVHLSKHHFQRLFTRWAGVSPKRFLQYVTVEYAKANKEQTFKFRYGELCCAFRLADI